MEVVRVIKNKNYTTISNQLFKDKTISLKAKGLMAYLLSLPNDWDLSINGIVACSKEGRRSIGNTIKELINAGYIERTQVRDKGKFVGYDYFVFEKPKCCFAATDKSLTDKSLQISKEVIKERINKNTLSKSEKFKTEVFTYDYPNSNIYDSKSPINIERVKGIKLFRKYRKANLVNNFMNTNPSIRAVFTDHWKSLELIKTEYLKKTRSFCLLHSKEINHEIGSSLNKRLIKSTDKADFIIANSNFTKKLAIKVGINPSKIHVIFPGIPKPRVIENVSKIFKTRKSHVHAVDNVSLNVEQEEFLSIVGPSGCGKSTLLKMIAGLIPTTNGVIRMSGSIVKGPRTDLGIVFQRDLLLDWKNILDNVLVQAAFRGLSINDYRPRAQALLELVGLTGFENQFPFELSGGMRQRVSLCRALLHNPKLLLMDEPFGSLDALTREQLNLDLQRIWQQDKKTVVFVNRRWNMFDGR